MGISEGEGEGETWPHAQEVENVLSSIYENDGARLFDDHGLSAKVAELGFQYLYWLDCLTRFCFEWRCIFGIIALWLLVDKLRFVSSR